MTMFHFFNYEFITEIYLEELKLLWANTGNVLPFPVNNKGVCNT